MEFTINKEVTETVTIQTPAYFKNRHCPFFHRITDDGIVTVANTIISVIADENWQKQLPGIINQCESLPEEFEEAYSNALNYIQNFKSKL